MAKILVTGGAGNIGSFIVDELIAGGHEVVIVDNFYNSSLKYIARHLDSSRAHLEVCDISKYRTLERIFAKWQPEYVSHQASMMIMDSRKLPFDSIEVNVNGTFNVIQAAIEHGVRRLTFASSASVFGDPRYLPVDEEHPFDNQTLYGATKIAGEALFKSWAVSHDLPWVGFRYYNTYSERQGLGAFYTQVFQKWIHLIDAGESITIFGDGEQTMDLIHSSDCAGVNVVALFNENVSNELFNVGMGIETSLNQLRDILFEKMGREVPVHYEPYDAHLVKRRCSSTEKLKNLLGFIPKISLDEGVDRYLNAFYCSRQNKKK